MRRCVSRFTDVITVHAGDTHRAIQPGEIVDLDEPIGAGTLADALGAHTARFEPVQASKAKTKDQPAAPTAQE